MDHSKFIHFSIFHFRLGVTFGVKHQTFAIPNQIYLGNEWKVAPAGHNTMLLLFPWLMWSHCYSNDGLFDQPHNGVITVLEFSAYEIFKVQIWKVMDYNCNTSAGEWDAANRVNILYICRVFSITKNILNSTEDGSTNAVLQILYGPYLILGVLCFRPKNNSLNIQMKLIFLWVWAERAVLGRAKTALKFEYEI